MFDPQVSFWGSFDPADPRVPAPLDCLLCDRTVLEYNAVTGRPGSELGRDVAERLQNVGLEVAGIGHSETSGVGRRVPCTPAHSR